MFLDVRYHSNPSIPASLLNPGASSTIIVPTVFEDGPQTSQNATTPLLNSSSSSTHQPPLTVYATGQSSHHQNKSHSTSHYHQRFPSASSTSGRSTIVQMNNENFQQEGDSSPNRHSLSVPEKRKFFERIAEYHTAF